MSLKKKKICRVLFQVRRTWHHDGKN